MSDATPSDAGMDMDAGTYLSGFSRVLNGALQVSAGEEHTCALIAPGQVKCWGRARQGQVDGVTVREIVVEPTRVVIDEAKQVAAGARHTCALTEQGVVCWGSNQYGQLGRDPNDSSAAPALVSGTQGVTELDCGVRHCCVRSDAGVSCWGELIDADGQPYVSAQPTHIDGLDGVLQISAGAGHSCALMTDRIACWGHNEQGQLGDGTTHASALPVTVAQLPAGAGCVAAGGGEIEGQLVGHSCAVDRAAQVVCWGHNSEGQLGSAVSDDHLTPQFVQAFHRDRDSELDQIARVELGAQFSCGLSTRGSVYCWGSNENDELGLYTDVDPADRMPVPGDAVRVQRFGRVR